jgi:hypothetical protein
MNMESEKFWSNLRYCTWQKSTSCPSTVNFVLDHNFRHGIMSKKTSWSLKNTSNLFILLQFLMSVPLLVGRRRRGQELVLLFTREASLLIQDLCLKEIMNAHILTLSSITLCIFCLISCDNVLIKVHFLFWAWQLSKKTIRLLMCTFSFKNLIHDFLDWFNTLRWDQ